MIKINIYKLGLLALVTPLLFISCSKDFLETEMTGASTEEIYFSTVSGINQLATGAYAALNPCPANLHNLDVMYLGFGSFASDEAEAGGEQGGQDLMDFQNWDQGHPAATEDRSISLNNWNYNYKLIMRCNMTLKGIGTYRSNNSNIAADSAAILTRLEGEMEFLRAFAHFKMTQIYGGIPIVDHILGSTEYNLQRNSVAECLHFVQNRLKIAIPMLSEKSQLGTEIGRASKGAAKSLLAKAFLYESSYAANYSTDSRFESCQDKYDSALFYAEEVINSDEYELVGINGETFDTYWNQAGSTLYPTATPGYRYIFTIDGENSDENIFSTQSINDNLGYMLSDGSYLTIYMAARNYGDGTTLGWGFNCPTEDLENSYEVGDPRKLVTIGNTGDPINIDGVWDTLDSHQSPTNRYCRKYESSFPQYWTAGQDGSGPNNLYYIRYADVVLMAAEAAFVTGDQTKALEYVNMVRTRARNGAATGVPANLSSITFEDIINERLLELACEGHRFFDVIRCGMQEEKIVGQEVQKWLGGVPQEVPIINNFTVGVNEFFPIPLTEIINSNGSLVQYQGYE
jgi:starch-binding outer membrane protein, SusD/RagB family